MTSLSDPELVARCLEDDAAAWEILVGRYADLVYAVARRQGLSAETCGDVVQDVFLALLRNLPRLRRTDRLLGWVVQSARRESWKKARRTRRAKKDEEHAARPETDQRPLPGDDLADLEVRHLVRDAYAALGERCRQLLDPLFLETESRSYAEVAKELGLAIGSLGSMRRRCLSELRRQLAKRGLRPGELPGS